MGGRHNKAVLAARLEVIDEELVPWAPLLAAPLDVDVETTPEVEALDPAFWRARLHGVMGTLLGQLLDSPTLLVFDDVHWMDDASSELLRYLGTQLPTKPWLACTTRRPTEGGFAAAEGTPPLPALTLRLEPLPAEDAKTLAVAAAGDRRLTEEELAALMERGAGNPLFLQELASVGEKTDEAEELPETVEALVATRIDQLGPGDRALFAGRPCSEFPSPGLSSSTFSRTIRSAPRARTRGIASASSSSEIRTFPARSGSVTHSSATRRTKGSRTRDARAPWPRRRSHRAAAWRSTRGRCGAAVAALLQRWSLGGGMDVLARRGRQRAGGLRERRRGAVLRAGDRREHPAQDRR